MQILYKLKRVLQISKQTQFRGSRWPKTLMTDKLLIVQTNSHNKIKLTKWGLNSGTKFAAELMNEQKASAALQVYLIEVYFMKITIKHIFRGLKKVARRNYE